MQRRIFIQLTAYTAAVIALPFASGCAHKQIDPESQPLFFSHLVDATAIMETGRAYLKAKPAENDKSRLKDLLSGDSGLSPAADSSTITTMLANRVNHDFK